MVDLSAGPRQAPQHVSQLRDRYGLRRAQKWRFRDFIEEPNCWLDDGTNRIAEEVLYTHEMTGRTGDCCFKSSRA